MKLPEILRIETAHRAGSLARVLQVIGDAGLIIQDLEAVQRHQDKTVWEITLEMDDDEDQSIYQRIDALPNAQVLGKSDRIFRRHQGGKIQMASRLSISSLRTLRDIYTPGVAQVCLAIKQEPEKARQFTALSRTVAIVTNGTAILGLGDIGPVAGLPVMEGKAALFAELAGLSGIPILLEEKDPVRLVEVVSAISSSFGAIQLEDIAAPACFEIESKLRQRLPIPVLHDDQHGTAVVVLAAMINAARRTERALQDMVVGQIGLGAAGLGLVSLLRQYGVKKLVGTDLRPEALARFESMGGEPENLRTVMAEADMVVGLSGAGELIDPQWVRPGQVILALSNPVPEIYPRLALDRGAAFAFDGRAINNVLSFPGLFRGVLDAGARSFHSGMFMAAAQCLADIASESELVPDPLDRAVHKAVSEAVYQAAIEDPPVSA